LASSLQGAQQLRDTASRLRWGIAGLLFAATFLNYLDREVLSVVSPVLRKQFQLSATDYSHLLAAFLLGYTVLQPFAGRFADRVGARRGLMAAMLWWSSAAILAALVRSTWQLGFFLFLLGGGESANWPISVKTIQEWFVPRERGIAIGFFNCGSSAGAIAAPIVIAALTLRYSWRISFIVSGALGIVWIVPWLALFRRERVERNASEIVPAPPQSWLRILCMRNTIALMGARFFADPLWIFFVFWLPDYLNRSRHFSLARIGATAWLPFLTAGLGNLVGGHVSGTLIRRGIPARSARLWVMSFASIAMLFGCTVSFISDPLMALYIISIVTFAYSCWAANVLTLPSDLFPTEQIATVVGFSGMAAGGGSILVMLLVGILVDHISYVPALIGISCLPLLALFFGFMTTIGATE
jgi:ACS family hexuronate transporter-like MFS transporter